MEISKDKMAKLAEAQPGRKVPLGGTGIEAVVMPARWGEIKAVIDLLGKSRAAIELIVGLVTDEKQTGDADMVSSIVQALAIFPKEDLLPIVQPCTDVDLSRIDWSLCAPIFAAWIEESFGGGKLAGWRDLGAALLKLMPKTGSQPQPPKAAPEA